jgi:hypothetical protein
MLSIRISHAERRLSPRIQRTYDQENATVRAFHRMYRVISDGRRSDPSDRDNLWRLLVIRGIRERMIDS